jgi:hypothetical protein
VNCFHHKNQLPTNFRFGAMRVNSLKFANIAFFKNRKISLSNFGDFPDELTQNGRHIHVQHVELRLENTFPKSKRDFPKFQKILRFFQNF